MKAGSWPSIGLIYLYGVLGSASLSKVIPLQQDFATHLGASASQYALLISLLTVAPAVLATVGGSFIDRIGARRALIAAALLGGVVNFAYLMAPGLRAFQALRILEGCVIVGAYSAAPGLIIATAAPTRRGPAMAFWSTYTPVGVSLGLAMSSLFAGEEFWRGGYVVHGALWLMMAGAGVLLPSPAVPPRHAPRPSLLSAYAQAGPMRVALSFAALVIMGFGVNTVFPPWYSQAHGVSLADASRLLAAANLSMILGSFAMLVLLGRGIAPLRLFIGVSVCALAGAAALFSKGQPQPVVLGGLLLWLVSSGAATAVVTASLPQVVASPAQGAAAAGLLSQMAALATFITPPLWLGALQTGHTASFLLIVALAWALALLLLPRGRRGPSTAAPAGAK